MLKKKINGMLGERVRYKYMSKKKKSKVPL